MADNEDDIILVSEAVKSIPLAELEACIAEAIAKKIGSGEVNCNITRLETSGVNGLKLKMQLTDNLPDDYDYPY